eukprot:c2182_g1_i1.p1 GENE.c2182_g1_i1~~c2182_g1_i1.p1  ORF type:complete len:673 (+),score=131.96 c2182_g1_i1:53-2071(+)
MANVGVGQMYPFQKLVEKRIAFIREDEQVPPDLMIVFFTRNGEEYVIKTTESLTVISFNELTEMAQTNQQKIDLCGLDFSPLGLIKLFTQKFKKKFDPEAPQQRRSHSVSLQRKSALSIQDDDVEYTPENKPDMPPPPSTNRTRVDPNSLKQRSMSEPTIQNQDLPRSFLKNQVDDNMLNQLDGSLRDVLAAAAHRVCETDTRKSMDAVVQDLWENWMNMRDVNHEYQAVFAEKISAICDPVPPTPKEPKVSDRLFLVSEGTRVKGGTLKSLVYRLTVEDTPDPEFVFVFLLTYRSFASGQQVLSILRSRLLSNNTPSASSSSPSSSPSLDLVSPRTAGISAMELRGINALKRWIEDYYQDFDEDRELLNQVTSFIRDDLEGRPSLKNMLNSTLQRAQEGRKKLMIETERPKPKPITKRIVIRKLPQTTQSSELMEYDPKEIARQLCLYSSQLFRSITPMDILQYSKKKMTRLNEMVNRFNIFSFWAQQQIIQPDDAAIRGTLISKFIKIADECVQLNNYHDAQAICAALGSANVFRLQKSFAKVPEKLLSKLEDIKNLLKSEKNYGVYRDRLKLLSPQGIACVPFLGTFQSDIVFIEDGNPDFLTDIGPDVINFEKRRKAAGVIRIIQQFQQTKYALERVENIAKLIESIEFGLTDNQLHNMSLQQEPRQS